MPVLLRYFNMRAVVLEPVPPPQRVSVLQPDGDYLTEAWGGFIDAEQARELTGAKPVRLEIAAWQLGNGSDEWVKVPEGKHVLGCQVGGSVRAVLYAGVPRVV